MKAVPRFQPVTLLVILLLSLYPPATWGQATAIYGGNAASGNGSGSDCNNTVAALTFFNNSSNWGKGFNQIGPGTTFHLCGTITGSAGSFGLHFNTSYYNGGSGNVGSPITIKFESGAKMQAPYWGVGLDESTYSCGNSGGAITIDGCTSGLHDIVIDGGTVCGWDASTWTETTCNGTIENTANGSSGGSCLSGSCTYQQTSNGVFLGGSLTNIEVKNLGFDHIFVHVNQPSTGDNQGLRSNTCIDFSNNGQTMTNVSAHNFTCRDAGTGVGYTAYSACSAGSVSQVYNATFRKSQVWKVFVGASGTNACFVVHDFEMDDWSDWNDSCTGSGCQGIFHSDGIIAFAGGGMTVYVYNGYIWGLMTGGNSTCYIYNDDNVGPTNYYVFNMVLVNDPSGEDGPFCNWGVSNSQHYYLYNNTFILTPPNSNSLNAMDLTFGSTGNLKANILDGRNNILVGNSSTPPNSFFGSNGNPAGGFTVNTMDYGDYYLTRSTGWGGDTLSQWGAIGANHDQHSVFTDPLLTNETATPNISTYFEPTSTSGGGHQVGENLTSSCTSLLTALCTDIAGNARPSSGAWDAGAYQYITSDPPPNPPHGLTAVVE